MLNREVYEVGVDEHLVGRTQLGVMLEVHAHFGLLELPDLHRVQRAHFLSLLCLLDILALLVDLTVRCFVWV